MALPLTLPLVLAVALAAPGSADSKTDRIEPPVFGSEVSLVAVPVFVVDKRGRAMRGLQPEDFELFDDKRQVPIVSFQYVDTSSPESQDTLREAPAARRRFLLLFDMSFTDPGGVMRARRAARDFVQRGTARSDLVAVATFDTQRGVRVVANFTEDRSLLLHAVDTLGVPSLAHIQDPLSLALSAEQTDVTLGLDTPELTAALSDSVTRYLAMQMRAVEEQVYRSQVLQLLGSLQDLAGGLRGVEGRKQVLYFSAGFDAQVMVGTAGSDQRLASEAVLRGALWEVSAEGRYGDPRLRTLFRDAAQALSNADCVVHSIDVTGLGRDDSLTRTRVNPDPSRLEGQATAGRESLNFLAAETGGRFFKDANDLGLVLAEVLEMTSRYYVLGYQPSDLKGPGAFHKLKVKVRREGGRVSHRAGYFERMPRPSQTALQQQFESAQLVMHGIGPDNLPFTALCFPFPSPGGLQPLGLVLQLPREEIPEGRPLSLEVYGYAVGDDGTVHDHIAQLVRVDIALADPARQAKGLSFQATLQVPPGRHTLKLMMQNVDTGESGAQFIDLTVPPYDPNAGFLLPPLVMEAPGQWLSLELGRARGPRPAYPFTLEGEPFLPRTSFAVRAGVPEKLVLIAYDPDRASDPAADLEIRSSLTDAKGAAGPAGRLRIDRVQREPGGRRTYVFEYVPDPVAPGDYTLRIGIGEAGTELAAYTRIHVAADDLGSP